MIIIITSLTNRSHHPFSLFLHKWPDCGEIEFCDASVRYASHLPNVLDGITLTIRGGESIGIVGRTGAGKSSLSLALFRFLDLSRGNILIDGVDVVSVGLSRLRRAMTIIPQDPTLFTGTIRSNMDPFGEYADEEICAALGRAHLLGGGGSGAGGEEESSSSSLLDFTVMEGGANYSQGQRQLLCLARAMLRKSRIIIMDEATASVDHETDGKIQRTIRSEFRGSSTVLCIAHRLKTVIEYDKILVLDKGRVVEFGSPRELLKGNASSGSLFQIMCQETGEMAELMEMCMG